MGHPQNGYLREFFAGMVYSKDSFRSTSGTTHARVGVPQSQRLSLATVPREAPHLGYIGYHTCPGSKDFRPWN